MSGLMLSSDLPSLPKGAKVYTVGELTRSIKGLLEEHHASVWVEGELSNLARPHSGHLYFTLKDEDSALRSVLFRGVALRLKYDLHDGLRVIVRGRLTVYVPRGDYQLQIEEVQPKGIGPLELAFRQRKEKLFQQGYFAPHRKKPLPRYPARLALITSGTGSAVRDMLEVLARRWPAVEVWVCPVRVQGEGAAAEIAVALDWLNRIAGPGSARPVEVLLLGRGGGSLEDLWPFNEEVVAHAIYRSIIPVVTGIGHEDDLTIADLVADVRALTPTEAAERVVPHQTEILEILTGHETRLRWLLTNLLTVVRSRINDLASRSYFRRPEALTTDRQQRLQSWQDRLEQALRRQLQTCTTRFNASVGQLESLSPLKVLTRGYTLTQRLLDLSTLRSAADVVPGDWIVSRFVDGRAVSRVETVQRTNIYPSDSRSPKYFEDPLQGSKQGAVSSNPSSDPSDPRDLGLGDQVEENESTHQRNGTS